MFKNLKILRPLLAILIIFIPLYPKFPLLSVQNTYVAIRLDDIVVASVLLIWGLYQIKNGFPILKHNITKLFLVYFLTIMVSGLHAYLINQTEPLNILLLHLFRRFEYISLFFVAIDAVYSAKDFYYPLIAAIVATIGIDLYGFGQKYLSFPVISTMNEEFSKGQLLTMNIWTRISSTFAGHYDLAAYMSVFLVILGAALILTRRWYLKFPLILIWLFSFQILTMTASRVSIFAFFGGMVATLILIRRFLWIAPVTLIVAFSVVSSDDLNQRLLATIPALTKKPASPPAVVVSPTPTTVPVMATPTPGQPVAVLTTPIPTPFRHGPVDEFIPIDADAGVARSGEIRFNVEWPRAIAAFRKNILLGTGLGSITLATDNDYLRALGESGLIGFLSFSAILGWFMVKTIPLLFKKTKSTADYLALILFGALLTHLANAIFIDVFEASKTAYLFWIMMGFYYRALNPKFNQK